MSKLNAALIALCSLASTAAFANPTASMDYSCEADGQTRKGKISIDADEVKGQVSCMFFGRATICYRFERINRISDVFLVTRNEKQLIADNDRDVLSMSNVPYAEGATSEDTIQVGLFKKVTMTCTYTNVNWK